MTVNTVKLFMQIVFFKEMVFTVLTKPGNRLQQVCAAGTGGLVGEGGMPECDGAGLVGGELCPGAP